MASPMDARAYLKLSVAVALATIALKTGAWWVTGSVGLLSDAMESLVNLAGATFALAMVTVAALPADEAHPYGHHKAEYFSSGFEGLLIIVAALAIGWAAVQRLLQPQPLEAIGLGLALSVLSSVLNGALAWAMLRKAREVRSAALEGDARHLFTDVWTSAGVLVAVVAVTFTGWLWLDPLIALLMAANILRTGVALIRQSADGLMIARWSRPCARRSNPCWTAFGTRRSVSTTSPRAAPGSAASWTCTCTCPRAGRWGVQPRCAPAWSRR